MMLKSILKMRYLLLFITSLSLHSEIPFTEIKDMYTVVKPEMGVYSPVNGFAWWKNRIIENMYRFGDKQKSPTIALLYELFHLQHDQITFGITTLNSKPAKYFKPSTIGIIIAFLRRFPDKDSLTSDKVVAAQKELLEALKIDLKFGELVNSSQSGILAQKSKMQQFADQFKNFKEQSDKNKKKIDQLNIQLFQIMEKIKKEINIQYNQNEKIELEKQVKDLQDKNLSFNKLIKEIKTGVEYKKVERLIHNEALEDDSLQKLVGLFLESLKESFDLSLYVPFTTQQILLAFLWKMANEKRDFIEYFKHNPEILQDQSLFKNPELWTKLAYTQQEYEVIKPHLTDPTWILQNYEAALFGLQAERVWDQLLPPIISSINSEYQKIIFPNCGETSVRNFFNILLKKVKESALDISLLKQAASEKSFKLNPALVEFYGNFNSLAHLPTKRVHDAWNQVVSNLPGVSYLKPDPSQGVCEINAGLDNMLRVLNHLLFSNDAKFNSLSKQEKLNKICEVVSRPDFKITWELQNEDNEVVNQKDIDLKIDFSINDEEAFTWEFLKDHFVITARPAKTEESMRKAAFILANKLNEVSLENFVTLNLINWFVYPGIWSDEPDEIIPGNLTEILKIVASKKLPQTYVYQILKGINYTNVQVVLSIIDSIFAAYPQLPLDIKLFIEKLMVVVPKDDPDSEDFKWDIIEIIAKNKTKEFYYLLTKQIEEIKKIKDEEIKKSRIFNLEYTIQDSNNKELYSLIFPFIKDYKVEWDSDFDFIFRTVLWMVNADYDAEYDWLIKKVGELYPIQYDILKNEINKNNRTKLSDKLSKTYSPEFFSQKYSFTLYKIEEFLKSDKESKYEEAYNFIKDTSWRFQLSALKLLLEKAEHIKMWQDPEHRMPQKENMTNDMEHLSNLFDIYFDKLEEIRDLEKQKDIARLFLQHQNAIGVQPLFVDLVVNLFLADSKNQREIESFQKQLKVVLEVATNQDKFEALWWLTFASFYPITSKIQALKKLFSFGVNSKLQDKDGKDIAYYLHDKMTLIKFPLVSGEISSLRKIFQEVR